MSKETKLDIKKGVGRASIFHTINGNFGYFLTIDLTESIIRDFGLRLNTLAIEKFEYGFSKLR